MKEVNQLKKYIKKHGFVKVCLIADLRSCEAIKMWIKRSRIPHYHYTKLKPFLKGEKDVEIRFVER